MKSFAIIILVVVFMHLTTIKLDAASFEINREERGSNCCGWLDFTCCCLSNFGTQIDVNLPENVANVWCDDYKGCDDSGWRC